MCQACGGGMSVAAEGQMFHLMSFLPLRPPEQPNAAVAIFDLASS